MKIIGKLKLGGLQQKIFNLMLIFIIALVAAYAAVAFYQQNNLSTVVQEASAEQQASITAVSEQTMEAVLNSSMAQTTALQAYIANDLFAEVKADVLTLQTFAGGLFDHAESFEPNPIDPPSAANDGVPTAQLIHEAAADPEKSEYLGLAAHMSDIMIAMYKASDKLSSIFVGTADGNMVLINDRSSTFVGENGEPLTLEIRRRPWYVQAAAAGELIFTGVELDAYTDVPMLECAAPVYHNGELVAVVSADVYLQSINDYVESKATDSSFVCVVNEKGQMLFSPADEGTFKVQLSTDAKDLRESDNKELADFVTRALKESTGLALIEVDGKEYYMCGSPMETVGWTVISVVDKEVTYRPTATMLDSYARINEGAMENYRVGARNSARTVIWLTVIILVLATAAALILAKRVVKPLERMTSRLNSISGSNQIFEMEKVYRTGDEIEILAESFAALSERTKKYITQITQITAEKERVNTELNMATQIQESMLPNIYPAFPDRAEFDIYATMDPAREVGGDFYDFFLVDDDHLCMVMADVSGKGVPAALFMMASKIILQNNAMMGKSPAQILTDANAAICANNKMEMFVTTWLGILEISTGKLTAANAGHEYPALKRRDGGFELQKGKHGVVIGGLEGVKYKEYEMMLMPGDKLFLYTDGVPEATSAEKKLFGTERMIAALNSADAAANTVEILRSVRRSVDDFVKEAEQFDDITMLCLEYKGKDD